MCLAVVDILTVCVLQDPFYSELLQHLRSAPSLVARLLLHCEQNDPSQVTQLVNTIYSGIYGNGILQEDGGSVLQVSLAARPPPWAAGRGGGETVPPSQRTSDNLTDNRC